jgi:hypothetical protein
MEFGLLWNACNMPWLIRTIDQTSPVFSLHVNRKQVVGQLGSKTMAGYSFTGHVEDHWRFKPVLAGYFFLTRLSRRVQIRVPNNLPIRSESLGIPREEPAWLSMNLLIPCWKGITLKKVIPHLFPYGFKWKTPRWVVHLIFIRLIFSSMYRCHVCWLLWLGMPQFVLNLHIFLSM